MKKNKNKIKIFRNVKFRNKLQGNLKKIIGYLKVKWGKLTNNTVMKIDGNMQMVEGVLQEKFGINLIGFRKMAKKFIKKYSQKIKK